MVWGWCHNATCPDCTSTIAKGAILPPAEKKSEISIMVNDEDLNFTANTSDNLLFSKDACDYASPLSDNLQTVFQNTVQHLNDNADRIFGIDWII